MNVYYVKDISTGCLYLLISFYNSRGLGCCCKLVFNILLAVLHSSKTILGRTTVSSIN